MTEHAKAAEHMPGGVIVYPEFQLRNFFNLKIG